MPPGLSRVNKIPLGEEAAGKGGSSEHHWSPRGQEEPETETEKGGEKPTPWNPRGQSVSKGGGEGATRSRAVKGQDRLGRNMDPGFSNREVTWTSARVPSEDCGYWSEAGREGGREGSEAETTRASGHKREEKAKVGWVEE